MSLLDKDDFPTSVALATCLSQLLFAVITLTVAFTGVLGENPAKTVSYATCIVFGVASLCGMLSSRTQSKGVLVTAIVTQIPCMVVAILFVYSVAWSEMDSARKINGCKTCELFLGMLMFMSLMEGTLSLVVIVYACRNLLQDVDQKKKFIISSKMSWESLKLLENSTQFPIQPATKNIDPYYYYEDYMIWNSVTDI